MTVTLPYKLIKKDELQILNEKIAALETQINLATEFVKEIEKGNLTADYSLSENTGEKANVLAESLLSLRLQLKTYSLQEKERNWVTEGLAKFIDILRSKNEDVRDLTDNIICNLVKYMGANQGALYLINDDNLNDTYIEMAACYAYDRKKHLNQRLEIGEGLTGQAFLEKESIYLTEVPQSYMKITSGLGDASPSNLLIVPLKVDENVFGIVEIASFEKIQQYKIEFVQRLGESIASTLANVKTGQKTKILLEQSQMQAEQMRSQEEEVRQNMEELSATQEEMQRVLKEAQDKEKYLIELINVPKDSIFTLDKDFKILSYNKTFGASLEAMLKLNDLKGFDFLNLFPDEKEKQKQRDIFARAFKGENFEITSDYNDNGKVSYYSSNYAPLHDENGAVFAIAGFAKDVTEIVFARNKAEAALHESKQQGEELRAQEEELRQNMEELSATQEEMNRLLKDLQLKEKYLNDLINVPKDSIFTVDKEYKIISYNKAMSAGLEAMGIADLTGFDMLQLYPDAAEKKKQKMLYDRALAGENFEVTTDFEHQGVLSHYAVSFAPLLDEFEKPYAVACFGKDVTALVNAQKQTKK